MKLAFVFPGQGSQAVGMLDSWVAPDAPPLAADQSLVAADPARRLDPVGNAVAAVLAQANRALDEDLANLIAVGPAETLNLTVNTQPAMLAAGVAALQAWRAAGGPEPFAVAGHSLGEYAALVAAGSLRLDDALRLVRIRAQAMQDAVPVGTGAMAAILGLADDVVLAVCEEASSQARAAGEPAVVEAVNFNAPAQVVLAGHVTAIDRACALAKVAGAKRALPLAVSAPFHSSLLRPAGAVLARALATVAMNPPQVPLVNNIDVAIESEPERIRDALVRQAWGPVRWVEVIARLQALGASHVIEFGPGKVLSGLVKRIAPDLKASAVYDRASLEGVLAQLRAELENAGTAH